MNDIADKVYEVMNFGCSGELSKSSSEDVKMDKMQSTPISNEQSQIRIPPTLQRNLREDEILRDIKFPGVYIKKYIKSEKQRPYDITHACKNNKYSHIQDHLGNKHKFERK